MVRFYAILKTRLDFHKMSADAKLDAGGKPSTWFPPGRLVEHIQIIISCEIYFSLSYYVNLININFYLSADAANNLNARPRAKTGRRR